MELYLVRHPTPAISPGVCYGHAELDLHENAVVEITQVQDKLAHVVPAALYTSPLRRCRLLAEAFPWGVAQLDARLKELHFGEWELKRWDALSRDSLDIWAERFVHQAPPGGESFQMLYDRALSFFNECVDRHLGKAVVAVTHAGVIRALLAHAVKLPLENVPGFKLDFGSVTKLVVSESHIDVAYVNR